MKMRFYFQEYKPDVHQELWRWHFATEMGSGEYDIPKCNSTNTSECVNTITAHIQVSDFVSNEECNYRSGLNMLPLRAQLGPVILATI